MKVILHSNIDGDRKEIGDTKDGLVIPKEGQTVITSVSDALVTKVSYHYTSNVVVVYLNGHL